MNLQVLDRPVNSQPQLNSSNVLSYSNKTVSVMVQFGELVAIIQGGLVMHLPVSSRITFDASASYDQDNTGFLLNFQWSCTIVSTVNFGSPCNIPGFAGVNRTSAVLQISPNTITVGVAYLFQVLVTTSIAGDNRQATASVLVKSIGNSAPLITSPNQKILFNPDEKLSVDAYIQSVGAVRAEWSLQFSSQSKLLSDVSFPTTAYFTTADFRLVSFTEGVAFPIAFAPNAFSFGRDYTF